MRIAYFINQYPKVSHTFIRREIQALERRGIEVLRFAARTVPGELVDPEDKRELLRTEALLGVGYAAFIRAFAWIALRRPRCLCDAFWAAVQLGRRSDAGIFRHLIYLLEACLLTHKAFAANIKHIHAHFGTNSAAVVLLVRKLGGPTYSITVHGPEEFDMPRALSLALKVENASFTIAISAFCRSQLYRWIEPMHWPRIHEVHCALDPAHLGAGVAIAPIKDTAEFLCIGRLAPEKGQLILLQALKILVGQGLDVHVTFAGDGPLRSLLENAVKEWGLEARVTFAGWVDEARINELLRNCRALVLSSFAEGLPVVLMEALAMGRPAISTCVAGIPELIEHGKSGWLVPPADVALLATAMREAYFASPERLTEMGLEGRKRVIDRHNVDREAEKLHKLFESVIRKR